MALTLRTNGTGGGIVSAAWWNDYYSLLTGVMTDQPVTIANSLTISGTFHSTSALSSANLIMDFEQSFGLYSDNAGTFGGSTKRLWFSSDVGSGQVAEMQFGPRSTTALNWVRFLAANFRIDGTNAATPGTFQVQGGVKTSLDAGAITTDGLGTTVWTAPAAAGAPTLALAAGTALGVGAYSYKVAFVSNNGATTSIGAATAASITTTTNNQDVNLTAIPLGVAGTTERNLYRTKVGGSVYFFLATLADNTTTTYSDTTADASLGAAVSGHPSAGGALWKTAGGTGVIQLFSDGAVSFDTGKFSSDGLGNVFATGFQTNRNGTLTPVQVYTGANTPSGDGTTTPQTGAIWVKA